MQPKKTSVLVSHSMLQGNDTLRSANCGLIICTLKELFVTSQRAMPCCKGYRTLGICNHSDSDKLCDRSIIVMFTNTSNYK